MDLDKKNEFGGYRYESGTTYVGPWNKIGFPQGFGNLLLPDGTIYRGDFDQGKFHGKGILNFSDGSKYEGEFVKGWFHGHGIFWRADGMKYEGEFKGGKIWGLGLTTFNNGYNGFPKYEGYFQDSKLLKRIKTTETVQLSQKIAYVARNC